MQTQPVVQSFAVGFSPISVFFPVQRTGPANTKGNHMIDYLVLTGCGLTRSDAAKVLPPVLLVCQRGCKWSANLLQYKHHQMTMLSHRLFLPHIIICIIVQIAIITTMLFLLSYLSATVTYVELSTCDW